MSAEYKNRRWATLAAALLIGAMSGCSHKEQATPTPPAGSTSANAGPEAASSPRGFGVQIPADANIPDDVRARIPTLPPGDGN